MEIAIISDIHGNYDALSQFGESCDEVCIPGDPVTYGPEPAKCIKWTQDNAAIVIQGNHGYAAANDDDS